MATVTRVRRLVANPRRRPRKKNIRRRLTPRQIKFFGSKAQKAALKNRNRAKYGHRKATPKARTRRNIAGYVDDAGRFRPIRSSILPDLSLAKTRYDPEKVGEKKRKRHAKKSKPRKRKRTSNPALIVTLGAVNPTKRRKVVARKRKRVNKARSHRRRNATRVVVTAPRRQNPRRVSRRRNPQRARIRRRNPVLSFGAGVPMPQTLTAIGGGLVGVAAAKFIPTVLPAQMVGSNLMRTISTAVAAFISGWLAGKVNKGFGDAVLFGGLMQTGSTALNAFLPSVAGALGLTGLGAFANAQFAVPENPLMRGMPAAPPPVPRVTASGIGRAFGNAF